MAALLKSPGLKLLGPKPLTHPALPATPTDHPKQTNDTGGRLARGEV
ncbi:hypothetical protein [Deinococcus sp. UYEF24]